LDEKDDARDDLDEAGDEEQHAGLYRVRVRVRVRVRIRVRV